MNKILVLALALALFSTLGFAVGEQAGSCDADDVCETTSVQVGNPVGWKIPPETLDGGIIAEGAIATQKYLQVYGPGFFEDSLAVGSLVAPKSRSVYAENVVNAKNALETEGYVIIGNPLDWLIPPEALDGGVIAEGAIATQKYLKSYGPAFVDQYITVGNVLAAKGGSLYAERVVNAKEGLETAGTVQADSLKGTGNAFVCANSEGFLFRSKTPWIDCV